MTVKYICSSVLRLLYVLSVSLVTMLVFHVWGVLFWPVKAVHPPLFYQIETYFAKVMTGIGACLMWNLGYRVKEVGDDLTPYIDEECLVVCNHQGTGDIVMMMCIFFNIPRWSHQVMSIARKWVQYTPFGLLLRIQHNFFIAHGKQFREQELVSLKNHLQQNFFKLGRKWMFLLPEGGFLRKRRDTSQRYAIKYGFPRLSRVTLPRLKGMEVILQTLGSATTPQSTTCGEPHAKASSNPIKEGPKRQKTKNGLKYLIDITIGYPEDQPVRTFDVATGYNPPCQITLAYRVYPISDVPQEGEELRQWMYKLWVEKEELLKHFYNTNQFPQELTTGGLKNAVSIDRWMRVNRWTNLGIHLFCIISAYIQYFLIKFLLEMKPALLG